MRIVTSIKIITMALRDIVKYFKIHASYPYSDCSSDLSADKGVNKNEISLWVCNSHSL